MKAQDIADLKQLIEFLKEYQVAEFDLDRGDLKIRLKFNQAEASPAGLADLARLVFFFFFFSTWFDRIALLFLLRRLPEQIRGRSGSAISARRPPWPSPPAGAIYTCPMHPADPPGRARSCPICGMALEPETPTAEAGPTLNSST